MDETLLGHIVEEDLVDLSAVQDGHVRGTHTHIHTHTHTHTHTHNTHARTHAHTHTSDMPILTCSGG